MERELQRSRSSLVISGTAVLAFGAWAVIKVIAQILMVPDYAKTIFYSQDTGQFSPGYLAAFIFFCLVVVGAHVFIGLSARSEGKTGKRRYAYLFVCVLIAALILPGFVLNFQADGYIPDMIVSALVDITWLIALAGVFLSSVKVKKLERMQGLQDPGQDSGQG